MGYAFISYSPGQQREAETLKLLLRDREIDTWMAPHDIPEGSEYAAVINDAIRNAACFVLLLTKETQDSVYVDKEIERALHYGKTVAPIQLDDVVLNDSFSFYLCNQQIITVPAIDESLPKVKSLLSHLQYLCNDRLPPETGVCDSSRDKRVKRKRISRLIFRSGLVLWCLALFCGNRYVDVARGYTYMEMYGLDYVPTLAEIADSYLLYFLMAVAAVLLCLYALGLRDPGKQSWNPLAVISRHHLLPAFSLLCVTGWAMLNFAEKTAEGVVHGLTAYNFPAEGYELPQWMPQLALPLLLLGAAGVLLSALLIFLRGKGKAAASGGAPAARRQRRGEE